MAIITISRGSYSKGKEVAEKVAQKLGIKEIDVTMSHSRENAIAVAVGAN